MKRLKLAFAVFCCWITFPLLCVWLMLTHPGKCALIWKKELSGTWWNNKTSICNHDALYVCPNCVRETIIRRRVVIK